jgi:hypothetical protein
MAFAYRLLGLLVQARYQIALLLALANGLILLLELPSILRAPSAAVILGFLDTPLLLGLAVWMVANLPPGVVFQSTAGLEAIDSGRRRQWVAPPGSPVDLPRACRASGRFRIGDQGEWCLMVPSTLEITRWGRIEVRAPSYVARGPGQRVRPLGPVRLRWYRPGSGPLPIWAADPILIDRLISRQLERDTASEPPARLEIAPRALEDVLRGWQYVGLRRLPALRLTHRGEDGAVERTYLAFDSTAGRDAVWGRLG